MAPREPGRGASRDLDAPAVFRHSVGPPTRSQPDALVVSCDDDEESVMKKQVCVARADGDQDYFAMRTFFGAAGGCEAA